MTFGCRPSATSSACASEKLEHCAASPLSTTAQHARNAAMLTSGATPMMPSRLLTADAMMPAIAVPWISPLRASAMLGDEIAREPHAAAQVGVVAVDGGVDDRDRNAAARRELVCSLDLHRRRRGLQLEVRIVVLRGLRVEQVHALREIDARVAIRASR